MRGARTAVALALVALLAGPPPARADRREDLEALRSAIADSRERVATYEREQRDLLDTVEALDRAAELLAAEETSARRAAREARQTLAHLRARTAELERQLAATRRALRARATALYKAGRLGSVRLLFSAGGLPEFLSRVSMLRRLVGHDVALVARQRQESADLAQAREGAEASAAALSEAESRLEERSRQLARERGRKRTLLARVHASRTQERGALIELERAARALEETIRTLGDESDTTAGDLPGPPFLALRHRLPPPVDAPIARGFGRVVDGQFGTETFHSGVDFEAPEGTPVHAVAAGRVRFAGWFHGYGRMVILDHGDGYFSVCGHLDQVEVETGQVVTAGGVVGTVGETGSLVGPRLYFEIRKGGDALDPRDWLEPRGAG